MKNDLSLFWKNMVNNKYYVPMAFALPMGIIAACQFDTFPSIWGFILIESVLGGAFFGCIIGGWVTRSSQQ